MIYIEDVKNDKKNGLKLYRAKACDFDEVSSFLDRQREGLEHIEFFYPYTREELANVLANGMFMCVKDGEKIVATFGIDLDEEYAKLLAQIIRESTAGAIDVEKAYESSGLMTDSDYRGIGLGKYLMQRAVLWAQEHKINICGVVHYMNKASMRTFFGEKFILSGYFEKDSVYKFVYLLKIFNFHYEIAEMYDKIEISETDKLKAALQKGFCGVALEGNEVLYAKISHKA